MCRTSFSVLVLRQNFQVILEGTAQLKLWWEGTSRMGKISWESGSPQIGSQICLALRSALQFPKAKTKCCVAISAHFLLCLWLEGMRGRRRGRTRGEGQPLFGETLLGRPSRAVEEAPMKIKIAVGNFQNRGCMSPLETQPRRHCDINQRAVPKWLDPCCNSTVMLGPAYACLVKSPSNERLALAFGQPPSPSHLSPSHLKHFENFENCRNCCMRSCLERGGIAEFSLLMV